MKYFPSAACKSFKQSMKDDTKRQTKLKANYIRQSKDQSVTMLSKNTTNPTNIQLPIISKIYMKICEFSNAVEVPSVIRLLTSSF